MQIKIFTLPVCGSERGEEELNRFLRSHRVLQTERHFCPEDGGYWTILIEYLDGDPSAEVPPANRRDKKDYSKDLQDDALKRYERFKTIRRDLATRNGMPAYLIFTNEELAILAKMPLLNAETSREIKGIAPSRLKDHIHYFYTQDDGEESGQSDAADS